MIELTSDQMTAIDRNGEQPPLIVDPRTHDTFVLVRKEVYDAMQKWAMPLKRRWDSPADDDLTRTTAATDGASSDGNGRPAPSKSEPPFPDWKKNFDAWMADVQARAGRYPPGFVMDDSRESIYAGCGE